ncbi:hypothetical protein CYY_003712 [Polysphondylium violaceum]|uniref:Methyltransferase domain-containing protein n=1 Tax=Polysphondylium violaceum TaxID=133409 RepID=A0A8J4PUB1_9MYCE|nr:hypothetical protein CYY_003712 [Polysphondylium violaceum]
MSSLNKTIVEHSVKVWDKSCTINLQSIKSGFPSLFSKDAFDLTIGKDNFFPSNVKILDIGCGAGTVSFCALDKIKDKSNDSYVLATDFSPKMIESVDQVIKNEKLLNIEAKVMDGQNLNEIKDNSFDYAYSVFGLIFFKDRSKGFNEIYRVLKPNGTICISSYCKGVPFDQTFTTVLKKYTTETDLPYHHSVLSLSDKDKFKKEMELAGFKNIYIHQSTHTMELPSADMFIKSPVFDSIIALVPIDRHQEFKDDIVEFIKSTWPDLKLPTSFYFGIDSNNNNNNTNCGLTFQGACKSLPLAYQSFISNSNGSDITQQQLVLYVTSGVYNATENTLTSIGSSGSNIGILNIESNQNNTSNSSVIFNGFNYNLPMFSFSTKTSQLSTIVMNNIQFVNSSFLISSSIPLQLNISNCKFENVSSNAGLFYLDTSPYYLGAAIVLENSVIENIELSVGSSFFSLTNYTVYLDNVFISNITGSFTMYNCNATITNSIFNEITSDKSPISSFGSDLLIKSSSFSSNVANVGGAISFELLGSLSNSLSVQMTNFTNNYASSYGGSVFLSNTQKLVEFLNCNFVNNSGESQGGAINAFNLNNLCINTCQFINNNSPTGGAIYFNKVITNMVDSQVSNNNAIKDGGAFYVLNSNITMNSVSFANNVAQEFGDNVDCISSSIDIHYSSLSGNYSGFYCPFGGCLISGLDFTSGLCPGQNETSSQSHNNSDSNSSSNEAERNSNRKKLIIVIVCSIVGGILVLGVIALIISCLRKNQINKIDESRYLLNS